MGFFGSCFNYYYYHYYHYYYYFNICVLVAGSYFGTAEGNREPFKRRNFDAGRVRRAKTSFTCRFEEH